MSKLSEFVAKFREVLFGEKNEQIRLLTKQVNDLSAFNNQLNKQVTSLRTLVPVVNSKESEFNNKYPKSNLTYKRSETDGSYYVDLRDFYMVDEASLPVVTGSTDDEKALNSLIWIINHIKYTSDSSDATYKENEYWAYVYQTLKHRMGDCEDGAILLANIMQKSGVPYWKIRISAGDVTGGGHAYVTYYCEEKDKWVILDWCYWPNRLAVKDRKNYKEEANYKNVWFSWNSKHCFTKGTKENINEYLKNG